VARNKGSSELMLPGLGKPKIARKK
jgi:hypothetical protein